MKYDRHHQMKKYLFENKKADIQELSDHFHVSIETIRRDLNELEKAGGIKRVHGGAVLIDSNVMPEAMHTWDERFNRNAAEKAAIAREVIRYIPDNTTIAIDSGTTIFEFDKYLSQKKDLTIITNSLRQAVQITSLTDHLVYMIGGAVKHDESTTTGFIATDFFDYFSKIDIAVISSDGFDIQNGFSDHSLEMATIKKIMIQKASKVYYIAEHNKFSTDALYKFSDGSNFDMIITDSNIESEQLKKLEKLNIKLLIAQAD